MLVDQIRSTSAGLPLHPLRHSYLFTDDLATYWSLPKV